MKKVYTAIFLFVSLFFFYSNGVKADTINTTINTFDSINDTFFEFRDYVIQYAEENNYYYFISYDTVDYFAKYFNSYDDNIIYQYGDLRILNIDIKQHHVFMNSSISTSYTGISAQLFTLNSYYFLDTNFPTFNYSGTDEINFSYNNCSYTLTNGGKVRTLYDFYLASQNSCTFADEVVEDIHKEEKEILSNFYNLIFEKINLLANSIINNYIYLTVIGIFILIFLIYLIRRYFI